MNFDIPRAEKASPSKFRVKRNNHEMWSLSLQDVVGCQKWLVQSWREACFVIPRRWNQTLGLI